MTSDIGTEWRSAVLNDQTEADFIRQAQRGFGDNRRSYYMAVSTNARLNTNFDFGNAYLPGNSGDYCTKYRCKNLKIDLCKYLLRVF